MKKNYYLSNDNIKIYNINGVSHSHRMDLNEEVISNINIGNRSFIRETISLEREIGFDHLVETTEEDEIVLLDRGRGYPSRMVPGRKAEPTQKVFIVIAKGGPEDGEYNGEYILVTLFEGDPGMPEPYGRYEGNQDCINFWANHALVPTKDEMAMIKKGE